MKFAGSKTMYKDSPKLERDKDGKMGVSKAPTAAEKEADEVDGHVEGMEQHHSEMGARHNLERHHMHARHEHEHAMHKGGEKTKMHERHAAEHKDMLKKHDEELAGSGESEVEGE